MDPGFAKPPGCIEVHGRTRRHANLQFLELATGLCAGLAEAVDTFASAVEVEREAVPSLRKPCGAAVRLCSMASEHDLGMRFLDRTRHRINALEIDPSPFKSRFLHGP